MTPSISRFNPLKYLVVGVLLSWGFSSCKVTPRTPRKGISITPYFQDSTMALPTTLEMRQPQVSRIQKEDLLGITVSSLNKESNDILNFSNVNSLSMSALPGGGGGGSQPIGYPVDSSGNVSMAFIGKVKVEGLTLEAAQERIRAALGVFVKDPAVNIRFMNHKFVVLGEVNGVGSFNLFDDRTTIIDALASAGDLTIFANRDSIMIIRSVNGQREIAQVNLLNREIFSSPYFYIRNGDVLYAQPIPEKIIPLVIDNEERLIKQEQRQDTQSRIQIFTTVLTTIALLISIITRF